MIDVADLLRLAAAGPERLQRLAELASRLKQIEEEQTAIFAELAEFGVSRPSHEPRALPSPTLPADIQRCCICGEEGAETIDDEWYCANDGAAALEVKTRLTAGEPAGDGALA